jgi:hypothetical protein
VTKPFSSVPLENIDAIFECLMKLREFCDINDVKHLPMPKIATGLDQTPWRKVLSILNIVFENSDITLDVYTLPNQPVTQRQNSNVPKSPGEPKEQLIA